ncbi:MAG: hypothetical protein PHI68_01245 [Candidatus Cloacimonetes bacterium]|nr:hypothetical protein [Candidatus Cloacimonadota bacterium]
MKVFLGTLLLMGYCILAAQSGLPITEYDYHTPAGSVSPVTIGFGGLNVAYAGTYFDAYDNPALLADNEHSSIVLSFRMKEESKLKFEEAIQFSNALKDKQMKYLSLITRNAAWSYQPMASINISEINAEQNRIRYYDYQLDKWQISYAGRDKQWDMISAGINLKFLTGRLVRISQVKNGTDWIVDQNEYFIDDKVKGFSGDLGMTVDQGSMVYGVAFYDVYSKLFWENYDSAELKRRAAAGFAYKSGGLALMAGLQGLIAKETDTTFHFGLVQDWTWQTEDYFSDSPANQNFVLRLGMYSDKFNGTENITYTLGSGYYYNFFRFDFALRNNGMKLKDSEYIFSLGAGF